MRTEAQRIKATYTEISMTSETNREPCACASVVTAKIASANDQACPCGAECACGADCACTRAEGGSTACGCAG